VATISFAEIPNARTHERRRVLSRSQRWRVMEGRSSLRSSVRGIHPLAEESLSRDGSAGAHTRRSHRGTCKVETGLTPETSLGVLGMPGSLPTQASSYRATQARRTIVVSSAAGAVGSWSASWPNWRAPARRIAGGAAKCAYVRHELRFDAVVDHKAAPLKGARGCLPDGSTSTSRTLVDRSGTRSCRS